MQKIEEQVKRELSPDAAPLVKATAQPKRVTPIAKPKLVKSGRKTSIAKAKTQRQAKAA